MRRTSRTGARPRLLPPTRAGRLALACIVVFAILRSVAWASAQPGWLAPDEDYHWLYTEYVLTQQDFPHLDRPFATAELYSAVLLLNKDGSYLAGPRTKYTGRPHGDIATMDDFGGDTREPTGEPPRPVIHGPLYYTGTVLVDKALTQKAAATRLTAMRYYSALLGGLGVFLAWLLAAQVLPRLWQQLAAAALVATQPMAAFSAATLSNDVLALAGMTAVLAWCAFLLRRAPRARDGIGLGILIALTVLAKSTMFAVVPLVGLTLLLAWRTHRGSGRAVLGLAAWAGGALLMVAGWWYVRLVAETGSLLGNGVSTLSSNAEKSAVDLPLSLAPEQAWAWLTLVYKGYWFDYLGYEVTRHDAWYYLPLVVGGISALGVIAFSIRCRRTLLAPDRPALRQALVLLAAVLILVLPPLLLDVRRSLAGLPMIFQLGRFLIPAYPCVAVLCVLGISHLVGDRARLAAAGVAATVAASLALYWSTWVRYCLERFYGPVDGDWNALLRRVSFDKPEWVTPTWFFAIGIACGVLALAAAGLTAAAARRRAEPETAPAQRPGARAAATAP